MSTNVGFNPNSSSQGSFLGNAALLVGVVAGAAALGFASYKFFNWMFPDVESSRPISVTPSNQTEDTKVTAIFNKQINNQPAVIDQNQTDEGASNNSINSDPYASANQNDNNVAPINQPQLQELANWSTFSDELVLQEWGSLAFDIQTFLEDIAPGLMNGHALSEGTRKAYMALVNDFANILSTEAQRLPYTSPEILTTMREKGELFEKDLSKFKILLEKDQTNPQAQKSFISEAQLSELNELLKTVGATPLPQQASHEEAKLLRRMWLLKGHPDKRIGINDAHKVFAKGNQLVDLYLAKFVEKPQDTSAADQKKDEDLHQLKTLKEIFQTEFKTPDLDLLSPEEKDDNPGFYVINWLDRAQQLQKLWTTWQENQAQLEDNNPVLNRLLQDRFIRLFCQIESYAGAYEEFARNMGDRL